MPFPWGRFPARSAGIGARIGRSGRIPGGEAPCRGLHFRAPTPSDAEFTLAAIDLSRAAEALTGRLREPPRLLLVLGSGIVLPEGALTDPVDIPFDEIPGFPRAGVVGHPGQFRAGRLEGVPVLAQRGRFHFYEGHSAEVVAAPIRLAAAVGVRVAVLTNASGGIRAGLDPGTLVLLEDHIGLQGRSVLAGPVRAGEPRFPDQSAPYDPELMRMAEGVALELGIPLPRGCYGAVLGPNFETPAEIRMLRTLGADLVGMSTVPEVVAAGALGMRVLGISLVANRAAGLTPQPLSHTEVLAAGVAGGEALLRLLQGVVALAETSERLAKLKSLGTSPSRSDDPKG